MEVKVEYNQHVIDITVEEDEIEQAIQDSYHVSIMETEDGKQVEVIEFCSEHETYLTQDETISFSSEEEETDDFNPIGTMGIDWKTCNRTAIRYRILNDFKRIEAKEPWKRIYRLLRLPFYSNQQSDHWGFHFEGWDNFWILHGRAVWEREYWAPLDPNSDEFRTRKQRQENAKKAFCIVAMDLYTAYGKELLDRIDIKNVDDEPHEGWWYRSRRPTHLHWLLIHDIRLYQMHMSRYMFRWPRGMHHIRTMCSSRWCLNMK